MAVVVSDPGGVQWSVRRKWWPFFGADDLFDLSFIGLLGLLLALPLFVLWPFWLATKFLGARWRIIVERDHADASTELVRGWRRSTARINDLALEIAQGRHQYGRFVL
ncbi:hypothetical protein ACFQWH_01840 [Mycolicibacterium sp. GCM10028919]|uniref:hypothetical protein n=1 Tax=Mycolicibacterium sp. GCM10028919 TaxID=3273401 RepID=UPI00361F7F27